MWRSLYVFSEDNAWAIGLHFVHYFSSYIYKIQSKAEMFLAYLSRGVADRFFARNV
jgi:hypothetical protein